MWGKYLPIYFNHQVTSYLINSSLLHASQAQFQLDLKSKDEAIKSKDEEIKSKDKESVQVIRSKDQVIKSKDKEITHALSSKFKSVRKLEKTVTDLRSNLAGAQLQIQLQDSHLQYTTDAAVKQESTRLQSKIDEAKKNEIVSTHLFIA